MSSGAEYASTRVKIQIKAVEMVRRIRDEQAQLLAGKSDVAIIALFRKGGGAARWMAKKRQIP